MNPFVLALFLLCILAAAWGLYRTGETFWDAERRAQRRAGRHAVGADPAPWLGRQHHEDDDDSEVFLDVCWPNRRGMRDGAR